MFQLNGVRFSTPDAPMKGIIACIEHATFENTIEAARGIAPLIAPTVLEPRYDAPLSADLQSRIGPLSMQTGPSGPDWDAVLKALEEVPELRADEKLKDDQIRKAIDLLRQEPLKEICAALLPIMHRAMWNGQTHVPADVLTRAMVHWKPGVLVSEEPVMMRTSRTSGRRDRNDSVS